MYCQYFFLHIYNLHVYIYIIYTYRLDYVYNTILKLNNESFDKINF